MSYTEVTNTQDVDKTLESLINENHENEIITAVDSFTDLKHYIEEELCGLNENISNLNTASVEIKRNMIDKEHYQFFINKLDTSFIQYSENQKENTSKLVEAISSVPDGSYSLAITSGVIGAIVAAIAALSVNYFYQKYINNENKKSHFADISISILDSFEKTAILYWIEDKIADEKAHNYNSKEMERLELKIKSEFTVLRASLGEFLSSLSEKEFQQKTKVTEIIEKVYDLATGSSFETVDKKCDKSIAAKISTQTARLKSILLKFSQHTK